MRKLSYEPKNPKHFIALCFVELRTDSSIRQGHELMKLVWSKKNVALFKCAYGYFFIKNNSQVLSKEFIKSKIEVRKIISSLS